MANDWDNRQENPLYIYVMERSWVILGRPALHQPDPLWTVFDDCAVIRRWGTDAGLGQLAIEGRRADTILDPEPAGTRVRLSYVMARIPCDVSKWVNWSVETDRPGLEGGPLIFVMERSWVRIGRVVPGDSFETNTLWYSLSDCAVIRRWGTTEGLGQLCHAGRLGDTILDAETPGTLIRRTFVMREIPCYAAKWASWGTSGSGEKPRKKRK